MLKKALLLATILLILLTGCRSTEKDSIVLPKLSFNVERPVLVDIPVLDEDGMSDSIKKNVACVVFAYNTNLVELITYIKELESFNSELLKYYDAVRQTLE